MRVKINTMGQMPENVMFTLMVCIRHPKVDVFVIVHSYGRINRLFVVHINVDICVKTLTGMFRIWVNDHGHYMISRCCDCH